MKLKTGRRAAAAVLVMCYFLGQMLTPVSMEASAEGGVDALLAQRNEGVAAENVQQKKEVKTEDFTDVKEDDWFYPYLDYLVGAKMINGKTADSFAPQSEFSYAECSAVIVRYLGLEKEAEQRMGEISQRSPELSKYWYAGYFEVLSQLCLFTDYGLFETQNGLVTAIDRQAANSPIVRYRFAESVSKSFELNSPLKAKNVFSEMGGCGREFVVGGEYNKEILSQYESLISDFADVPEQSREYVLKAYYNGIFCGDESGSFYPDKNITRAEMAKVLAAISDFSLRTRLVNDTYGKNVSEDMLHTDAVGVKTMRYEEWQRVLAEQAKNLWTQAGFVVYTRDALSVPSGYAVDVYMYEKTNDTYTLVCESTLRNPVDFTYWSAGARILLVLRNTVESSRVEGVLEVRIENGAVVSIQPLVCEM